MSRHRYRCDLRPLALVLNEDAMVRAIQVDLLQQSGFRALEAETTDQAFNIALRRSDIEVMIAGASVKGSITGPELAGFMSSSWPKIHVVNSRAPHTDAADLATEIVGTVRAVKARVMRCRQSSVVKTSRIKHGPVQRYVRPGADAVSR